VPVLRLRSLELEVLDRLAEDDIAYGRLLIERLTEAE